jgi:hypothetical protein
MLCDCITIPFEPGQIDAEGFNGEVTAEIIFEPGGSIIIEGGSSPIPLDEDTVTLLNLTLTSVPIDDGEGGTTTVSSDVNVFFGALLAYLLANR